LTRFNQPTIWHNSLHSLKYGLQGIVTPYEPSFLLSYWRPSEVVRIYCIQK
jgi:hypothetical protein